MERESAMEVEAEKAVAVVERVYKDQRLKDVVMKLVGKPVEVDGVLMAPCKGCDEQLSVDKDHNIVWVRTHIGTLCPNTCGPFWKEIMESNLGIETMQWLRDRYKDTWRPFFDFMLEYPVSDVTTTPGVVEQLFEELRTLREKVSTAEKDFVDFKNELKLKELEHAKNEAEKKWQEVENNRKRVEKTEKENQQKHLDFERKLEQAEKERQEAVKKEKQSVDKLKELEKDLQREVNGRLEAENKEKEALDKLLKAEKDLQGEKKSKLDAENKAKEAREKLESNETKQMYAVVTVIVAGIFFVGMMALWKRNK